MVIFKQLEAYIRELTTNAGYLEISTPIMVKTDLFKTSGHWEKFGEHNMYHLALYEEEEISAFLKDPHKAQKEERVDIIGGMFSPRVNYSLKPMNCPESTIVYRFRKRTYRELPLRLSEIGRLHRREKSGEVNGLLRVRQLTMDDAHIFATEQQVSDEISRILDMMITFYTSFGFTFDFRLATRPKLFAGTKENWQKAEKGLVAALSAKKLSYSVKDQDGAFYGPKIDVHIKDSLGREWQLATVQLDFHQPHAFTLTYTDRDGEEKQPVMIHRAIFGSFERFIAILTEHYQAAFPLWLSPLQVIIIPISDRHLGTALEAVKLLQDMYIRAEPDSRSETMQAKIRSATLQKVPYMGIIGDKEVANQTISVRSRDGKFMKAFKLSEFAKKVKEEIDKKI